MGIFKVSLYYYKNAFQPWFNVKTSKTDLENRQNTHFYPFRGVWGGQPIKAKVSGTSKYIIITLFNYMFIIEKLVFIQHLTHRALGTYHLFYASSWQIFLQTVWKKLLNCFCCNVDTFLFCFWWKEHCEKKYPKILSSIWTTDVEVTYDFFCKCIR